MHPEFDTLADAFELIAADYFTGQFTKEQLQKRWQPKIRESVTPVTSYAALKKAGCPALMRKIGKVRSRLPKRLEQHERKVIRQHTTRAKAAEKIAESILKRKQRGAERHFDRIEALHDKAHDVLADTKPTKGKVGIFLGNIEQLDKIGRRLYGIDDETKALTAQQLNVAVLVNLKPEDLQPQSTEREV